MHAICNLSLPRSSTITERFGVQFRLRNLEKTQRVARPAYANATVPFLRTVPTDWLCYCHPANDL